MTYSAGDMLNEHWWQKFYLGAVLLECIDPEIGNCVIIRVEIHFY